MNERARLGRDGEDLAARRYELDGYDILERNFRCAEGEIDIVARRGDTIVFCEVKTRRTDYFGDPSEAVTPLKQTRLRRLAMTWMRHRHARPSEIRFDVVSIVEDGRGSRVRRLENAF